MKDVQQIETFLMVAQKLSFTRAAQSLLLTQSAVSHQISTLERNLGTLLFFREGKSIALTQAGLALQKNAPRIIALLAEVEEMVRAAAHPERGSLRIGASTTACQYLIPESLREFRESYPDYSLSITPGDSPAVIQLLLDGFIDLGIIIKSERIKQLQCATIFQDELGFLVSSQHPWARARKVDREQISSQHYILYTRSSATFQMIADYFTRHHLPLKNWTELGSMEAIKEIVKLGLGVSITAPWIARPELHEGSLTWLKLPSGYAKRQWCIAYRSNKRLSIAEQTFVGLCQAVAQQIAPPIFTSKS